MGPHEDIDANVHELDNGTQEDLIGHDPEDLAFLHPEPGNIVLNNPKPPQRLEWFSVVCIICNRMIGTGIFSTPTTVIQYTHGVGITLLFWLGGAIAAMAGILVYMEFGLTTPRYYFMGQGKISVPRNGGELHYLKDIIRRPLFLSTCVFGLTFVLLGNVATNSISFGIRVLEASGKPVDNFAARGIAIAVVSFACVFHGTWRQGGIYLNNIFALIKITMLLVIIITGFVSYAGVFKRSAAASNNFNVHKAFKDPAKDSYGFAESFLAILFAFGGFNQANYVMSEIDNPIRGYKWPAFLAVAWICILYMLVNIEYFIVVPVEEQLSGVDVAQTFFEYTFGTISSAGHNIAPRVLAGFMAVSSLGNIIVMTYTAARVKQEIAKEGILPFRRFISRNFSMPNILIGKLPGRLLKPVQDETPIGALILHWSLSVLLILATGAQKNPDASYQILKSRAGSGFNTVVSTVAAALFTIANAFPIIAAWIPPTGKLHASTGIYFPWYATPTVGWTVIALGFVYWLVFRYIVPHIGDHKGKKLKVQRKLFFHEEHQYPVQWHEQLKFDWVTSRSSGDDFAWADEDIEVRVRGQKAL
ncbi:hypothetical protein MMC28_010955 [Mycoblastus sanguinarius]|nr:hypothetical protein [Mycoblastus sanguinarius]